VVAGSLASAEALLVVAVLDAVSDGSVAVDSLASTEVLVVAVLDTVSDGVVHVDSQTSAVELMLIEARDDEEAEDGDEAEDGVDAEIDDILEDDDEAVDGNEREEELFDTAVDEVLVRLLAPEIEVDLLLPELKIVLLVTEPGDEEEEGLAGTPTMTYPAVVPDGRTVDVNPVAPAAICVVLVAYF
jgi:hypothetical protein